MNKSGNLGPIVPLAVFFGGIGGGIVFPILPVLGLQFGLSAFFIGVVISANKFARIFSNQIVGISIDTLGGKKPLILGLIIESIGSLLYIASIYLPLHGSLMLLGRVVWGVGSAFVFISANTIALNMSVHSTRGKSTAKIRIALSLGVPAGLVLGGTLSSLINDTAAFLSSAIASLFAAALVAVFFNERKKISSRASVNLKESFGFMFSSKNRNITTIALGNLLTFFALQGVVMATLVLFIKEKHLYFIYPNPKFSSGVAMALMMISSGITGILTGKIIDKIKFRSTIGFPATFIVFIGFLLLAEANNSYYVIISLIMLGTAIGANSICLLSILGDITPTKDRGKSVSVFQLLGDIGGTIGPIFGIQIGMTYGFTEVYLITGFIFFLSILVFLKLHTLESSNHSR